MAAWGFYIALAGFLQFFAFRGNNPDMAGMPLAARLAVTFLAPLFLFALILLIGYVNGDARRRGMRYVMWTLLAIFIPHAIGIILYFILRDPLPRHCAACGGTVAARHVFCPQCGASSSPACTQCGKPVESSWANCPYCGVKLPAPALK